MLDNRNESLETIQARMRKNNPVVIPRNHEVEAVLVDCQESNSPAAVERFLKVLASPYTELPDTKYYQNPPDDRDVHYKTFCGT